MVAELIREAALEGVRDELPHSIAVVVEEMLPREDRPADRPLLDIHANVYIERPSQKGIVIGPKGARLKEVGIKSRKQIEALLGTPGLPRPACEGREGLAAGSEAAAEAGFLIGRPQSGSRRSGHRAVPLQGGEDSRRPEVNRHPSRKRGFTHPLSAPARSAPAAPR